MKLAAHFRPFSFRALFRPRLEACLAGEARTGGGEGGYFNDLLPTDRAAGSPPCSFVFDELKVGAEGDSSRPGLGGFFFSKVEREGGKSYG